MQYQTTAQTVEKLEHKHTASDKDHRVQHTVSDTNWVLFQHQMPWDKRKNKVIEGRSKKKAKYGRTPVQGKLSVQLLSLEERQSERGFSYNGEDGQELTGHSFQNKNKVRCRFGN